jgi:hypothetical protein
MEMHDINLSILVLKCYQHKKYNGVCGSFYTAVSSYYYIALTIKQQVSEKKWKGEGRGEVHRVLAAKP